MPLSDQFSKQFIVRTAIIIVIVAGIIAALWLGLGVLGVSIPGWVITLFWILVVVVVIVTAIKFLASLF